MKVYYILKYSEKYTKKAGSNSETSLFKIKLSYFEKAENSYFIFMKGILFYRSNEVFLRGLRSQSISLLQ